jgi:hypothetical protein
MVRPAFLVALVAALVAAGASLEFSASSRARMLRSGVAPASRSLAGGPVARPPATPGHHHHARRARHHAAPAPTEVLRVRDGARIPLRERPGGRVLARVGDHTDFGSATTLSVVERRGRWASVPATVLGNGRLGWVDTADPALARRTTTVALVVRLGRRQLELRSRGRVVRTVPVAVGKPGTSTPRGRFAVTDKMRGGRFGPYYGCCILALTGHQPRVPSGWTGGDRLAIHGTNAPASIGTASSAGCLRAAEADLVALMRTVPAGAPVVIRD